MNMKKFNFYFDLRSYTVNALIVSIFTDGILLTKICIPEENNIGTGNIETIPFHFFKYSEMK